MSEQRVAATVIDAFAPFHTAAGGYTIENRRRYLIATA
jgi:hypothetical protein